MSGEGTAGPAPELERLRSILGPDEESYVTLRAQRDAAEARARELEAEIGVLNGKVKRLDQIMWRRTARRQRITRIAQRLLRR